MDCTAGLGSADDRVVARPLCATCGEPATFVELVPPGLLPHDFETWPEDLCLVYSKFYGGHDKWHFIYRGIEGANGCGDDIDAERAAQIARAFAEPYTFAKVHGAGFYDDAGFCGACGKPYCSQHWNVSSTGYGTCPEGHGKSLDPHWYPDDDYE